MPVHPSETLLGTFAPLLPVDDLAIVAHQAPDFFALWDAMEREAGIECAIPYWAAVWPGSRLIARYVLQNREIVAGKKVLDFGSGGGVAAIAASLAGAQQVVGNDIDPIAHFIASRNSAANGVYFEPDNRNLLTEPDNRIFDTVFVADMFYERSTADPLLYFLRRMRGNGAEVFIADGNRPFAPKIGLVPLASDRFKVNYALEGCAERTVMLLRFVN